MFECLAEEWRSKGHELSHGPQPRAPRCVNHAAPAVQPQGRHLSLLSGHRTGGLRTRRHPGHQSRYAYHRSGPRQSRIAAVEHLHRPPSLGHQRWPGAAPRYCVRAEGHIIAVLALAQPLGG